MRRTALLVVIGALLAACSDATPAITQPDKSADYRALEAILGSCSSSQSAVATALQGADTEVALSTLRSARDACSLAADKLRQSPIPSFNSERASAAIDEMAGGLDKIAEAVKVMDRAPTRAREAAQAGMAQYKRGLQELQASSPS